MPFHDTKKKSHWRISIPFVWWCRMLILTGFSVWRGWRKNLRYLKGQRYLGLMQIDDAKKFRNGGMLCEKFRIRCKNVFFPKTTLNFFFYVVNLSSLVLCLAHSFVCPLYTQGKILFFAFEVKIYHVKQVRLNTWGWCWLRRGDTDCLWGWCSLPWSGSECLVWYWMLMQNISHRRYAMQKISHAVQKSLFLVQDVGYPSKNSL